MISFKRILGSPSLLSIISVAIRATLGFALLPFILSKYSPGDINVWFLFTNVMVIQNTLDAGFAPTMSRYFAYGFSGNKLKLLPIKEEKIEKLIGHLFSTIKTTYFYVSLIIFFLLATIGSFLLYNPIEKSENPEINFFAWVVLLMVSLFYIRGNKYSSLLLGTNKVSQLKIIEIISSLLIFFSSLIILLLNLPIAVLLINNQLWVLFRIIANKWLSKKYHNYIWLQKNIGFDKILFKSIFEKSWKSGIGALFSNGVLQFSGIFYANVGTENQVSLYLFSLRILTLISQLAQAPFYSKIPVMQILFSKGKNTDFMQICQQRIKISMWFYLIVVMIFLYSGEPILSLVGSNIEFPPKLYLATFILAFAIERLGAMYIQMYTVTNKIIWHKSNVTSGVIFIILALSIYQWFEFYALPIAFLFSNILFYLPFNLYYTTKEFGIQIFKFEKYAAIPVLGILILNLILLKF